MANTGKQSPLGINILGSLLDNSGVFTINTKINSLVGTSISNSNYTRGKIINDTCLRLLTLAINDAYLRGVAASSTVTTSTYNNLIAIGSTSIGALGNSKPIGYVQEDPSGRWTAAGTPATTGFPSAGTTGYGQSASWLPYDTTNVNRSVTQWGFLRLLALQAWNEINYNAENPSVKNTAISDFPSSFLDISAALDYNNEAIIASAKSNTFLDGVYSNMDDLITSDTTGVSLSGDKFGADLEKLGNVINLSRIDSFGLPSVLLETLGKYGAITQDLSLALLASELSPNVITSIMSGSANVTREQEARIYGAFLLISGENLQAILSILQCTTAGLTNLTDLLNVRKLFPNSYSSLTVPVYNSSLGLPTNSKTYYLIYDGTNTNSALDTPMMQEYVGYQFPSNLPTIFETGTNPENYSTPPKGFGSYLYGIIPKDQAIAAGAFSFTMRQIPNVDNNDIKNFAKVVRSMENTTGLQLVNGTSKPTNQTAINSSIEYLALGSGVYGSYTVSDAFGCMSGLPYPLQQVYDGVRDLQTAKLKNIYQQLYLAVTWERASVNVTYSTRVSGSTTYYTVTGITIDNPGGGYGRATAPAPIITILGGSGATAVATIGTDDTNASPNKGGTFGRVTSVELLSPGVETTTIPTVTIQAPPTDLYPVQSNGSVSTGGINTPPGTLGWLTPLNNVVQQYINQANLEISVIQTNNTEKAGKLITYWNIIGEQLKIEQRARYNLISPVSIPKDKWAASSPTPVIALIDSIPNYALSTAPHMYVQTLEAISNLDIVGGESVVGIMRESRNKTRFNVLGIELDNNVPSALSDMQIKTLTTNGTIEDGLNNTINGYTNPAWAVNVINAVEVKPVPKGIYIPSNTSLAGTYIPSTGIIPADLPPVVDPNTTVEIPTVTDPIVAPPPDLNSIVPPNLDTNYTSSTLLPNSVNINEAIDKVIECNCDCWLS